MNTKHSVSDCGKERRRTDPNSEKVSGMFRFQNGFDKVIYIVASSPELSTCRLAETG